MGHFLGESAGLLAGSGDLAESAENLLMPSSCSHFKALLGIGHPSIRALFVILKSASFSTAPHFSSCSFGLEASGFKFTFGRYCPYQVAIQESCKFSTVVTRFL